MGDAFSRYYHVVTEITERHTQPTHPLTSNGTRKYEPTIVCEWLLEMDMEFDYIFFLFTSIRFIKALLHEAFYSVSAKMV